jgi:hypothetical protein
VNEPDPALGPADAVELCDEVYSSQEEAMAVARRLRRAGWIVPLLQPPGPVRPDGTRVVATVYHPQTFEAAGHVMYSSPDR